MADQIEGNLPDVEPVAETTTESGNSLDNLINAALDKSDNPELTSERNRDDAGRFAKNTEPDGIKPEGEVTAETAPAAIDPAKQPIDPHPRWSADLKAQFQEWPRNVQETFLARHNEVDANLTRKSQEMADFRKTAEPLVQAVQPFGEYLQNVGMQIGKSPPAMINELLRTEYTLRTGTLEQKAAALANIASSYGIPLAGMQTGTDEGQQPYRADPFVNHLYQKMPEYDQKFARLEQVAQTIENQQLTQYVDSIRQAKDASGNLLYPHFDALRPQIGALMQSMDLSAVDAYAEAIKPFEGLLQQQSSVSKEAEDKSKREALEKARKAAPVRASGSSPRGTSQAKGLDAMIAANMDRHGFN